MIGWVVADDLEDEFEGWQPSKITCSLARCHDASLRRAHFFCEVLVGCVFYAEPLGLCFPFRAKGPKIPNT